MPAYYNEIDKFAAQWLRNLISKGLIAPGDVDERDIRELKADDVRGYTQCHFFAGIGGWSYALRLAGWPDDRPVWTGSCPCQPFSQAGKRRGFKDERHLWPAMFRLIQERLPERVFGEQVASAIGHGWLDRVFADLEASNYSCGAVVLGAHSVGSPHIRQRLWWYADTNCQFDCGAGLPGEIGSSAGDGNRDAPQVQQTWNRRFDELVAMGIGERVSSYGQARALLDGIPGNVVGISGAGNAIVPQVAAEFVKAYMKTLEV